MMSSDTANTVDALKPGEAMFSLVGLQEPQVTFLVRERSAVIKYLGNTGVEARAALFPVGDLIPAMVVFRVGQYISREYATWWDYHHEEEAGIFSIMSCQDILSFHFHGDNGRLERSFVVMNPLKEFFTDSIEKILILPPWDRRSFLEALMGIQARFPTPRDLWIHAGEEK